MADTIGAVSRFMNQKKLVWTFISCFEDFRICTQSRTTVILLRKVWVLILHAVESKAWREEMKTEASHQVTANDGLRLVIHQDLVMVVTLQI